MFHKIIYKIGTAYRNPSLSQELNFLQKTDWWSMEQLQQYQLQKCKEFLIFAYQNSPYYTRVFDQNGFDPAQMNDISELSKIPVVGKKNLITHSKDIQSRSRFATLRFSESSGSTGQPLGIYRSEEWDSGTRAVMFRGYDWYGVKPWDKNGYLWGYNIDPKLSRKIKLLDRLQNRFRLFSYSDEEITAFCKKLQYAVFLSGYSSMIYEVAKKVNELGLSGQFPNLKMVKGTSEKIYDSYQEEVEKAFGLKMISEYGAMESGIIAFECPEEGNMHIAMEHVVVEEVDGSIVITNLLSHSFPIIRYQLGDYIKLAAGDFKCTCGRSHPVILEVLGRVGKNIQGNTQNFPSLTFYYVFKNMALHNGITLNYQAVQHTKGTVVLKIEQDYSSEFEQHLQYELHKYFKEDIQFDIEWNCKLHTMDGKLKDFITTLE